MLYIFNVYNWVSLEISIHQEIITAIYAINHDLWASSWLYSNMEGKEAQGFWAERTR